MPVSRGAGVQVCRCQGIQAYPGLRPEDQVEPGHGVQVGVGQRLIAAQEGVQEGGHHPRPLLPGLHGPHQPPLHLLPGGGLTRNESISYDNKLYKAKNMSKKIRESSV